MTKREQKLNERAVVYVLRRDRDNVFFIKKVRNQRFQITPKIEFAKQFFTKTEAENYQAKHIILDEFRIVEYIK